MSPRLLLWIRYFSGCLCMASLGAKVVGLLISQRQDIDHVIILSYRYRRSNQSLFLLQGWGRHAAILYFFSSSRLMCDITTATSWCCLLLTALPIRTRNTARCTTF